MIINSKFRSFFYSIGKVTIFLTLCSFMISCNVKTESKDYKDNYSFTQNGCATGDHSFSASSEGELKQKYCEALKNDALNNYCASSMRYEQFKARCSGFNWVD